MSCRYLRPSPPRAIVGESRRQFKSSLATNCGNPYLLDAFSLLSLNSRHFLHQKIPSDQGRNEDGFGHAAKCGGSTASDTGQVIAIGPANPLDHADVA